MILKIQKCSIPESMLTLPKQKPNVLLPGTISEKPFLSLPRSDRPVQARSQQAEPESINSNRANYRGVRINIVDRKQPDTIHNDREQEFVSYEQCIYHFSFFTVNIVFNLR